MADCMRVHFIHTASLHIASLLTASDLLPSDLLPSFHLLHASYRYGCIGVNTWTGLCYGMETASWGGYERDNTPAAIQSGVGVVRNCLLFDRVAKSVVRTPLQSAVHLTQRNTSTATVGPWTLSLVGRMAKFLL